MLSLFLVLTPEFVFPLTDCESGQFSYRMSYIWMCLPVPLRCHLPCSSVPSISCDLEFRSRDLLRFRLNVLEGRVLPEWRALTLITVGLSPCRTALPTQSDARLDARLRWELRGSLWKGPFFCLQWVSDPWEGRCFGFVCEDPFF